MDRPRYSEEQYRIWLNELRPYLIQGNSLEYAINQANLRKHRTTLYEKSRLKDWFSENLVRFKKTPGEIVNEIFSILITEINRKQQSGEEITKQEWKLLRYYAVRHKSCRPFFINRNEKYLKPYKPKEYAFDNLEA